MNFASLGWLNLGKAYMIREPNLPFSEFPLP